MAMKLRNILLVAGGSLFIGAVISACGSVSGESHTHIEEGAHQEANVQVVMEETWDEWTFALDRTEVAAGEVIFEVTNDGKFTHELMVYPSQDISSLLEEMVEAARTGIEAEHTEEIEGLVADAEGEDELVLAPDESGSFAIRLTPGTYELACLIVEMVGEETFTHYEKGMRATLVVQ